MKRVVFTSVLLISSLIASQGEEIFKKRCSVCHGKNAQKSSLGVSKVIAGWKSDKIIEKLKAYKSGKFDQYGFGNMMRNRATKLTEKQMKSVAEYIESLGKPQR